MATFPSIQPDAISYDLGLSGTVETATMAGPIVFRLSNTINNYNITLTYANLRQSQINLIRQHYADSSGTHGTFDVPTALWGGATVVSSDSIYRYNAPPEETHKGVYFDVAVNLRVLQGVQMLYILDCGGAVLPATAAFSSLIFTGNAPFILEAGGSNPILVLNSAGAQG
jgi:hypothetical protein